MNIYMDVSLSSFNVVGLFTRLRGGNGSGLEVEDWHVDVVLMCLMATVGDDTLSMRLYPSPPSYRHTSCRPIIILRGSLPRNPLCIVRYLFPTSHPE